MKRICLRISGRLSLGGSALSLVYCSSSGLPPSHSLHTRTHRFSFSRRGRKWPIPILLIQDLQSLGVHLIGREASPLGRRRARFASRNHSSHSSPSRRRRNQTATKGAGWPWGRDDPSMARYPSSFSRHTSPHPIRRTPASEARGGAPTPRVRAVSPAATRTRPRAGPDTPQSRASSRRSTRDAHRGRHRTALGRGPVNRGGTHVSAN